MVVVRHALVILVTGTLGFSGAAFGQALSSGDPPGRVGRLAFTQGTVSFHDSERTDWEAAAKGCLRRVTCGYAFCGRG